MHLLVFCHIFIQLYIFAFYDIYLFLKLDSITKLCILEHTFALQALFSFFVFSDQMSLFLIADILNHLLSFLFFFNLTMFISNKVLCLFSFSFSAYIEY